MLQHYNVELKDNSVDLTEEGVALAEMVLETNDLWDENDPWARYMIYHYGFSYDIIVTSTAVSAVFFGFHFLLLFYLIKNDAVVFEGSRLLLQL